MVWRRGRPGSGLIASLVGGAVLALLLTVWLLPADGARIWLRERSLDRLLPLLPTPPDGPGTPEVAIVNIDRETLSRLGPWPWPRERLAWLVAMVTGAGPRALAIDILMAEPDRLSPAALARALGAATGQKEVLALAAALRDSDQALAETLRIVPTALGFALDPDAIGSNAPLPHTPILLRGAIDLPAIWQAPGLVGPTEAVAAGAQGFGALALDLDSDGLVRRVPLLVVAAGTARPGLAVEGVRLAQDAGALIIGPGATLGIGAVTVPLDADAALRLVPRPSAWWSTHQISVAALYDDPALARVLAGRIVLIGSDAPELGGLRATPGSPVTPSVLIQATAVDTMLRGPLLHRPPWMDAAEIGGVLVLGLSGLLLAGRLRPLPATALMLTACLSWCVGAAWAATGAGLLVDPAGPPWLAVAGFAAATLTRFIGEEWRARRLRASFEQHLAPEVVRRISADPAALRLRGEQREITALFTDIEGFTAMTERAEPEDLVALLDAYFDMAAGLVMAHGGMIEKIVGDAVHAIFNAPFALEGHPKRAVDCARALLASSETIRLSTLGRKLQLGRTRIGIETGLAIVGDVGGSRKLDYTAHGNVMNTAARLEAFNKELGSSICIGPGTAEKLGHIGLRKIGTMTPRGRSESIEVFTVEKTFR